jgi:hypothetical protein
MASYVILRIKKGCRKRFSCKYDAFCWLEEGAIWNPKGIDTAKKNQSKVKSYSQEKALCWYFEYLFIMIAKRLRPLRININSIELASNDMDMYTRLGMIHDTLRRWGFDSKWPARFLPTY